MSKTGGTSMARDLTNGSIGKLLLTFGLPLMCANVLQTAYNMVDMIVIGHFVGKEGLSAVNIGGEVLNLLTFIVMGFSNAGQVMLSQYIGAGRSDRIKGAIGTMFTLILSSAVVLSVICHFGVDKLLVLVNTPAEAMEHARSYVVTCSFGLVFIYGYNLVSGILRGMGNSTQPLVFITVATMVNLVLDLVFIGGMGMSAFGAALGTVIGQGVSFICSLVYLYRRRDAFGFDFRLASFRIDRAILPQLIKLGIPMCLQSAAFNISMMYITSLVNVYGVVSSAVNGIGNKLTAITSVVTNALTTAGSSIIGQNIGAGKYHRVPETMKLSLLIGTAFAALLSLLTVCFPDQVFGIFNSEPEVLSLARRYIPVAVLLFLGFGIRTPFFALINGSGHSELSFAVGILDGVVCRIGLALLLGVALHMGVMGYWYGSALAGIFPCLFGGVYYLTGSWKKARLVK